MKSWQVLALLARQGYKGKKEGLRGPHAPMALSLIGVPESLKSLFSRSNPSLLLARKLW